MRSGTPRQAQRCVWGTCSGVLYIRLKKQGILIRIQTGFDTYRIRIHARLRCVWKRFPTGTPLRGTPLTQRALRDILMSRGKNCLPIVSRQFLTRNYPRPNRLLKCLPNCLSPTGEGILSSFKIYPCGEGICETSERQKLSRGNFCPGTSRCLAGPTGYDYSRLFS